MSDNDSFIVPSQELLDKRFSFIENLTLRTNVSIAFRYIIYLIHLLTDTKIPSVIEYSIYKDIILYTSTIMESCIHYCLKEYMDKGKISSGEVMPTDWADSTCIDLYKIGDGEKVCGVVRKRKAEKLLRNTQFKTLNEACLKAAIFDQGIFEMAENLRRKRNRIHLAGLEEVDDYYQKKDAEETFKEARAITTQIQTKLVELNGSL